MVKRIIKRVIYSVVKFFFYIYRPFIKKDSFSRKGKSLVILKPDALGDYILFRNFIPCLLNDYPNVILIGNHAWKDVVHFFDDGLFIKSIFLNRKRFFKDFIYRISILIQAHKIGCVDLLIYPCFSREGQRVEDICSIISAKEKIAWFGDTTNQPFTERNHTAKIYTKLIQSTERVEFEFKRNRNFLSVLLGSDIKNLPSVLMLPDNNAKLDDLPERYALLFIGASAIFRQWSIEKFAQVAEFIRSEYNLAIVIGGGPSDQVRAGELAAVLGKGTVNLAGKTTLVELGSLIEHSIILVSNETGIPHIAVALKHKNIFVISNGNHYGRFTPYPPDVFNSYNAIYPDKLLKMESEDDRINCYGRGSDLDIEDISANTVINLIKNKFTR
ncbi:glycosyltransferase family 9 protein [Gallaecimonas mangrovi]|uniref:glycosyltransferase family 9 protein n=1 Tax=Gallaecimonas mangrovi TaxID=2291597 RepID=UPI000E207ADF|nr:glycosyltransferase family 9 protein [Gallaecimonas mangrovi]